MGFFIFIVGIVFTYFKNTLNVELFCITLSRRALRRNLPISVHNDLESALEKARGKIKEDKIEAGFEEEVSIEPKIKKREKEWRVSWTKSDSDCYQIFEIDK